MISNSRQKVFPPDNEKTILLHCCCAPCSGGIINQISLSDLTLTILFYNPNIHPQKEYERRKKTLATFAGKKGIPFFDLDYDPQNWFKKIKGLEEDPEKGERCSKCFDMRLERTALYAKKNGFKVFATTLGISRWKDMDQVNHCGRQTASKYPNLTFWDYNWREDEGRLRMVETAQTEHFYKQKYCGCKFSLKNANKRRIENGKDSLPDKPDYY